MAKLFSSFLFLSSIGTSSAIRSQAQNLNSENLKNTFLAPDSETKSTEIPAGAPEVLARIFNSGGDIEDMDFTPHGSDENREFGINSALYLSLKGKFEQNPTDPNAPAVQPTAESILSPALEACKGKLPDKVAYSNCVMAAISGEIARVDLKSLKVKDKAAFCSDVIPMFQRLLASLQTRFENGDPEGNVQKMMQDVLFVENALGSYKTFCGMQ